MISLSSKAHFRQRVIKYSEKYGVTKAGNKDANRMNEALNNIRDI